jgi:hypothetical protein
LLLALAGFGMVCGWFILMMVSLYRQIEGGPEPRSYAWLGEIGGLAFAGSWIWALFSSISLMREARAKTRDSLFGPSSSPGPPEIPRS